MLWIPDSSVACKWYLDEPDSDLAAKFHEENRGELAAPGLLLLEVANGILKPALRPGMGARLSPQDAKRAIGDLAERVDFLPPGPFAAEPTVEMAVAMRHSVYDCLYLAHAVAERRRLVTADEAFCRKAGDSRWRGHVVSLADALWRFV